MSMKPESVWDYPRPPRIESDPRPVVVVLGGVTIAESLRPVRVLETASPPTVYIPRSDVRDGVLRPAASGATTVCEWKGTASYLDAEAGGIVSRRCAWHYPEPNPGYEELAAFVSFYPGRVDSIHFGGERVRPQPGEFYGGWVTAEIEGPFKGEPGSEAW